MGWLESGNETPAAAVRWAGGDLASYWILYYPKGGMRFRAIGVAVRVTGIRTMTRSVTEIFRCDGFPKRPSTWVGSEIFPPFVTVVIICIARM